MQTNIEKKMELIAHDQLEPRLLELLKSDIASYRKRAYDKGYTGECGTMVVRQNYRWWLVSHSPNIDDISIFRYTSLKEPR